MAKKEDRFIKTVVDTGGFSDSRLEIYVEGRFNPEIHRHHPLL